ncbi:DotI/IcmL family type IV secretion protein [Legionella fallonii]|uniref:Putative IcmL n=1 Tax=Legionella fallonii LLAP-10 TaxID=1212491 RepID=A0A098G2E6_9GAMM|nr:DotI/IcmL family type IV secretion protein [Legionella fallonii]CEG55655.1 putative IcmL [Legionella fallonii LLAP-10]
MNKKTALLFALIGLLFSQFARATPDRTQLAVWANEAIIATYTINYKTFIQQQKEIAKYYSSNGWIAYSKALDASKLPEAIQKNQYDVTAVATQPPRLVTLDPTHWQATMTILVVYQNPQYQQRQNLKVVIGFTTAPSGQGVRGLSINSMQSTVISPPCQCPNEQPQAAPAATTPVTPGAGK